MQAIMVHQLGGPEVLQMEEIPTPTPGPGEVVVALQAAALNRRDILVRTREEWAHQMPFVPGSDGAGVVAAVGTDVRNVREGDAVVICPSLWWGDDEERPSERFEILGGPSNGTYAQYVRVPAENVFAKPAHLSFAEAAAFPLAGLTAWRALITKARIRPGERVFIPGVGSGVATFLVQIARLAGAQAYGTSGSADKLQRATELGLSGGALYTDPNWLEQVRHQTSGGVEVVVDSVGAATFDQCLQLLVPGGRLITFGVTTGATTSLDIRLVYRRQLNILGTTMGSLKEFRSLLAVIANGAIKPVIDSTFPLASAAEAHRRMEHHAQFGKIVLELP
ncbi:MAG: zinc-binding dehydrogenase [Anaerolineae bacterium]